MIIQIKRSNRFSIDWNLNLGKRYGKINIVIEYLIEVSWISFQVFLFGSFQFISQNNKVPENQKKIE